jgi:hypothetical protein
VSLYNGETFEPSCYPQFTKNVPAETFFDCLEINWPEVEKNTAVTSWAGERMDVDMAVQGLLH